MTKTLIALIALIACSTAIPLQEIKGLVERDECGMKGMQTLSPKIHNKVTALKQNPQDVQAQADLLALVDDAKQVYDSCGLHKKVEPVLGDAVKAAGIGFLLASNCFKDIGAVLLIADSVIEDHSDIVNDVVVLIFVGLLGRQGYVDCEHLVQYLI